MVSQIWVNPDDIIMTSAGLLCQTFEISLQSHSCLVLTVSSTPCGNWTLYVECLFEWGNKRGKCDVKASRDKHTLLPRQEQVRTPYRESWNQRCSIWKLGHPCGILHITYWPGRENMHVPCAAYWCHMTSGHFTSYFPVYCLVSATSMSSLSIFFSFT